jgi:prepilin-type N-terminal cleavage/methylation domain-containing protein
MKRANGFSLIELMVSLIVMLIVSGAAIAALMQAQRVTTGIGMEASVQENLRAGMHFLVRDLMQTGEGIPQAGISIPNNAAGASAIVLPAGLAGFFPATAKLSQITPGNAVGEDAKTVDPVSGAVLDGLLKTDIISVLYEDNTLVSSAAGPGGIAPPLLNAYPVIQAAPATPVCTGAFAASGLTVTLAPTCFTLPGGPVPLSKGDLIMFHNANGTALEFVTNVAGTVITFAAGDPAGLNQTGLPNGTVANLNVAGTPTSISRVYLVTYYVDSNTNPSQPQLIRQVNYPNYPSVAAATYPAQAVADDIENLSFSYDIINSTAPAASYPNGPGDAAAPAAPDTAFDIRAVNVTISGRSDRPYIAMATPQYFRNNLSTQVGVRSLAFANGFPTPATLP